MAVDPATVMLRPEDAIEALLAREFELRREYQRVRPSPPTAATGTSSFRAVLESSAEFLEDLVVIHGFLEAALSIGCTDFAASEAQLPRIVRLSESSTGLSLEATIKRITAKFDPSAQPARKPIPTFAELLTDIISSIDAVLASCPIVLLEHVAEHSLPALGHRCRLAFDRLKAIARRSHERNPMLEVLGPAYVEGRLDVPEIARAMDASISDAASELERFGYVRAIERTAAEYDRYLEAAGALVSRPVSDDIVMRDVLATQRIEDIDARPWLPMKPK